MPVLLPELFERRMKELLGPEFPAFLQSYDEPRLYGFRMNPLKVTLEGWANISPFTTEPVPWCATGFYYKEGERPGKHPYYHAGLYYIQEPSAMAPVELLDVKPGLRVLDLCAAPGGKSTQIAGKLAQTGLLVSNDNHPDRVKALMKNLELCGARNVIVTNETPERLAEAFAQYFDRILIDAPCSGEGMFRKEEEMVKEWSEQLIGWCVRTQRHILDSAAEMLAPGGRIVYSTCTFAPEENEGQIADFLSRHADFRVVPAAGPCFAQGESAWADAPPELDGTVRLWPHQLKGEGHYAAVLEKIADGELPYHQAEDERVIAAVQPAPRQKAADERSKAKAQALKAGRPTEYGKRDKFQAVNKKLASKRPDKAGPVDTSGVSSFLASFAPELPPGKLLLRGSYIYWEPAGLPALDGLRVVRPGLPLGMQTPHRFEPAHALALALYPESCARRLQLDPKSEQVIRYLKGETLSIEESELYRAEGIPSKGYVLVCAGAYPLGWGRWSEGMLKNDYPPGWRWT
ncbi:RsmB/NOP family class I SAM-dependent RNA methyltransferase [Paenibacillus turpanensis]|uniref:RsmB/NOP family class I SAM-dependent RNA methyltransferase n=1 Tax=Paenibacillus turpanensis TaxID=2689078 RepID=UPI00140DFC7B|nr:RsmB/NOP family class I SAM-dependent RNA methyltransferase [Paenibacillus turpanensis]